MWKSGLTSALSRSSVPGRRQDAGSRSVLLVVGALLAPDEADHRDHGFRHRTDVEAAEAAVDLRVRGAELRVVDGVGERDLVQFLVEGFERGRVVVRELAAFKVARGFIAVEERFVPFEASDEVAQTVFGRILVERDAAQAPSDGGDPAFLAETVHDLGDVILRPVDLLCEFRDGDETAAVDVREVHQDPKTQVGEAGETHLGVPCTVTDRSAQLRSATDQPDGLGKRVISILPKSEAIG